MGKVENLLFIHILENHFMPYAAILGGVFVPFSTHMHIGATIGYLFYVRIYNKCSTGVSHHLGTKKTVMVQRLSNVGPKGSFT